MSLDFTSFSSVHAVGFNNDLSDCNACKVDHSSIPISVIQQICIEH